VNRTHHCIVGQFLPLREETQRWIKNACIQLCACVRMLLRAHTDGIPRKYWTAEKSQRECSHCQRLNSSMKMEPICSSETLVITYQTTKWHDRQYDSVNLHRCKNNSSVTFMVLEYNILIKTKMSWFATFSWRKHCSGVQHSHKDKNVLVYSILMKRTLFWSTTFSWREHGFYLQRSCKENTVLVTTFSRVAGISQLATGYWPDGRRWSLGTDKNFLFSTSSKPVLGPTRPLIQWVSGALSPRVKRPWREAQHSPPTRTEDKNTWIYTSTPPYVFMV
jgi:hypothetical protein